MLKELARRGSLLSGLVVTGCAWGEAEAPSTAKQDHELQGSIARRIGSTSEIEPQRGYALVRKDDAVYLFGPDGTERRKVYDIALDENTKKADEAFLDFTLQYGEKHDELWILRGSSSGGLTSWTSIDPDATDQELTFCELPEVGITRPEPDDDHGFLLMPGAGPGTAMLRGVSVLQDSGHSRVFHLDTSTCSANEIVMPVSARNRSVGYRLLPEDDAQLLDSGVSMLLPGQAGALELHRWKDFEWKKWTLDIRLPDSAWFSKQTQWGRSGTILWMAAGNALYRVATEGDALDIRWMPLGVPDEYISSPDGDMAFAIMESGELVQVAADGLIPWSTGEPIEESKAREKPTILGEASVSSKLTRILDQGIAIHGDAGLRVVSWKGTRHEISLPAGMVIGWVWALEHAAHPILILDPLNADARLVLELENETLLPGVPRQLSEDRGISLRCPSYFQKNTNPGPGYLLLDMMTNDPLLAFDRPCREDVFVGPSRHHVWVSSRPDGSDDDREGDEHTTVLWADVTKTSFDLGIELGEEVVRSRGGDVPPISLSAEKPLPLRFTSSFPVASASMTLELIDQSNEVVVEAPPQMALDHRYALEVSGESDLLALGEPYTLRVEYSDADGSHVTIKHAGITFEPEELSLYEWLTVTRKGRALLLYFAVLLVGGLSSSLRGRVRAWGPISAVALGAACAGLASAEGEISILWFLAPTGSTAILLLAAGLLSQRAFQALAVLEPFRMSAPWVMMRSRTRLRWYASYIETMRGALLQEGTIGTGKAGEEPEHYVELPVVIREGDQPETKVNDASRRIVGYLQSAPSALRATHRPHGQLAVVLIEAPGGRGKSALRRDTIRGLLDAFEQRRSTRLPVLCGHPSGDVFRDASKALARHAFSKDVVRRELERGGFVLVYEDVVSAGVAATHFEPHLATGQSPLLLVSRPFETMRKQLRVTASLLHAEPLALTREELPGFIVEYGRGSFDQARVDRLASALASQDGTYLPVLVRLALYMPNDEPISVASIYEETFKRLLKAEDAAETDRVLSEIQAIVFRVCWRERAFYLDFAHAQEDEKPLLRRLHAAGILVEKQRTNVFDAEPRRLGYFHDSMRSYVLARHIAAAPGDWKKLEVAARDRAFRETEIFDMALTMMRIEDVGPRLTTTLHAWFRKVGGRIPTTSVFEALPPGVVVERTLPDSTIPPQAALSLALKQLRVVEEEDGVPRGRRDLDDARARKLGYFFRAIAVRVDGPLRDLEAHTPANDADALVKRVVDVLAEIAYDPELARVIARRAGFPAAHLPVFRDAVGFWSTVVEQAHNGRIPLEDLVREAARQFPHAAELTGQLEEIEGLDGALPA